MAACDPPRHFFGALLDSHLPRIAVAIPGRMRVVLPTPAPSPAGAGTTDGGMLLRQAEHALLLDMTTRSGGVWPRYGVLGGYDQPDDGQEEIFTASAAAALEWGLFAQARAVLDNYLQYFVRADGSILYRGMEMAQQGRILTVAAQYWRYTRDAAPLLQHLGA